MTAQRWGSSDRGDTLVEVLIAMAILGMAGVAVIAGLGLAAKSSDIHRKDTTGSSYLRNYAEDIQKYIESHPSAYVGCSPDYSATKVGFSTPPSFNTPTVTVTSINSTGNAVPCGSDSGLQLLGLTLGSTDGRASESLSIVVRDPCDTSTLCVT